MEVGKGECLTYNLAIDYVTVLRGFGGGGLQVGSAVPRYHSQ